MSYTDDEVKKSADFFANGNTQNGSVINPLVWAASEYLKAKAVIEWYGATLTHSYAMSEVDGFNAYECDAGNKARKYLDSLKKS